LRLYEDAPTAIAIVWHVAVEFPPWNPNEVLDFIAFLELRHGLKDASVEQLKSAQLPAMHKLWDNPDDESWNDA
jgi:hypothetical protein